MNRSPVENTDKNAPPTSRWPVRILLCAPFAFVLVLLLCSPNFRGGSEVRTDPLGSDFLHEWVGAHIMASPDRAKLYQPEHSLAVQHDAELIGFSWPAGEYYPMIYPPFYYVALSPLASLAYPTAIWVWMFTLAAAISVYFWLVLRFLPRIGTEKNHQALTLAILAATLFFTPLLSSLTLAHKSVFLLLILSGTYALLYHRRPLMAGLVFGLIAFKPHLGLLIGFAMLLKGQWRFVAGSALSVGFLVGMSFFAGTDLCVDYFHQCMGLGDYTNSGGYAMAQAHSLHAVCHLAFDAISPQLALAAAAILAVVVLGLLCGILRGKLRTESPTFALQFSAMVMVTVLLSPHLYSYDLTILLLPCMLIWSTISQAAKHETKQSTKNTGTIEINAVQRRWLLRLTIALFLGAGLFEGFANATRLQPSTFLLFGLLFLFIRLLSSPKGTSADHGWLGEWSKWRQWRLRKNEAAVG